MAETSAKNGKIKGLLVFSSWFLIGMYRNNQKPRTENQKLSVSCH